VQLSPFSRHFIPLRSKYSSQHLVLKHPQPYALPLILGTKFHTHTKQLAELYFVYFELYLPRQQKTLNGMVASTPRI
jgi:hypothetical protein